MNEWKQPTDSEKPPKKEKILSYMTDDDLAKIEQADDVKGTEREDRDFNELKKIREDIQSSRKADSEQTSEIDRSYNSEKVTRKGKDYTVRYVSKDSIYPAFGYAGGNIASVREDLPPRVKNFVKEHELYHCRDETTWGGWIGREIRANIVPGLKDPIGLLATIKASLTKDRLKFYLKRFRQGY